MKPALDKRQFGPWALVTGASSGIGKEFARQIAAADINVVLVARREALLAEVGHGISKHFPVEHRSLAMDLSQEDFLTRLSDAINDLDIGLIVSNAGTGNPGEFLKLDRQLFQSTLRLNTMAYLDIAHHSAASSWARWGSGNWCSVHGERRRREGICPHSRRGAPLRQIAGCLRYGGTARPDKHAGAGQVRVRPTDHADEADGRGTVRGRGS